jgi:hypothetical protein
MIKVFAHLNFQYHECNVLALASAKMFFDNGYGVSVLLDHFTRQYEIAVLVGNTENWTLLLKEKDKKEEIYKDLSKNEVSEIMEEIQNRLPL